MDLQHDREIFLTQIGRLGVRGSYRILRTEEVDAKDAPLSASERSNVATSGAPAATRSSSDSFEGTARQAAKLSISEAPIEAFTDVKAVVESLPSKSKMVRHNLKPLRKMVLNTAKRFGKARFAQIAARHVDQATSIPKYLADAAKWLAAP